MSIPFVGIDDFAFKKRESYGTIFIDLETGKPIDIIHSRDSAVVTEWLSKHPEICLITRDGSPTYAKAVRESSPEILQVADRWHVLHLLFEATKKTIYDHIPQKWIPPVTESEPAVQEVDNQPIELVQPDPIDKRWERIQKSQALYKDGHQITTIAKMLGVVRNTVYADLRVTAQPTRKYDTDHKRFQQLVESLAEKGVSSEDIEIECRALGYKGSASSLNKLLARIRTHLEDAKPKAFHFRQRILSLLWNKKNQNALETIADLHPKLLEKFPLIVQLNDCVYSFRQLMKEQEHDQLVPWLEKYEKMENPFIQTFIQGIRKDIDAILLGICLPFNNGLAEGNINRLKMIKRLMFGRAGLLVLRSRLLYQF